ncbi:MULTISPECIES: DUF4114 domain-containing protein [Methylotenera]|uniref:DUF4114 domain-containing protein n=1 Tax=Methylotenera TaxID=359407 RepID=UPI000363A05F|nr:MULTISPECIES: DUF4114 domain-containing protein [Methylotenera]
MKKLNGLIMGALLLTSTLVSAVESPNLTPTSDSLYVATAGEVFVTFLSKEASFSNDLFLNGSSNLILNNQTAAVGSTYSLGSFEAGAELIFKIVVNGGNVFYSGLASRNFDGVEHATYQVQGNSIIVGFEDLAFPSDKDYNDLVFSVSNIRAGAPITPVPEPEMAGMLMAGLGLLGFAIRRKNNLK